MIIIVDYGMGNLGSILNMLKKIGIRNIAISSSIDIIENAKKLILPGVGAFDHAMKNLNDKDFLPILNKRVIDQKTPCLGICLGMQIMFECSEEGKLPGLGWIKGNVVRFKFEKNDEYLKIPHMGWNIVKEKQKCPIFKNMYSENRYYFIHSYHVKCADVNDTILTARYGSEFTAGVAKDNVYGVQFHPEKSHKYGKKLLENFCSL
jgi:glutamine amidotransferase